jgi:hypothetical protein
MKCFRRPRPSFAVRFDLPPLAIIALLLRKIFPPSIAIAQSLEEAETADTLEPVMICAPHLRAESTKRASKCGRFTTRANTQSAAYWTLVPRGQRRKGKLPSVHTSSGKRKRLKASSPIRRCSELASRFFHVLRLRGCLSPSRREAEPRNSDGPPPKTITS